MRRLHKGCVPPGPLRGRRIASAEKPMPEIRGGRRARRSWVSRPRRVALSPTILFEGPAKLASPPSCGRGFGQAKMERFSRGRLLTANPLRSDPYDRPCF